MVRCMVFSLFLSRLVGNMISDEGAEILAVSLGKLTALRYLNLAETRISTGMLAELLGKLTALQELVLDEVTDMLAESLGKLTALQKLCISCTGFPLSLFGWNCG
jgi:hypothetical protein